MAGRVAPDEEGDEVCLGALAQGVDLVHVSVVLAPQPGEDPVALVVRDGRDADQPNVQVDSRALQGLVDVVHARGDAVEHVFSSCGLISNLLRIQDEDVEDEDARSARRGLGGGASGRRR